MARKLKLYMVVGEVSGDALGADLLDAFEQLKVDVTPLGMGGEKLRERGLNSIIDTSEIAMMGLSAVVRKLPSLLKFARMVADDILEQNPDVVLLVDSPEFGKQVAKRVKKKNSNIPIVKYVCPSVWAWREKRAVKMKSYIDHILAILPFEPALMEKLDGPKTTYVGHPLARLAGNIKASERRVPNKPSKVLLMPGSRSGEISRLLPIMEETVQLLLDRGNNEIEYVLPAVPHLLDELREKTSSWPQKVTLIEGETEKLEFFKQADLAIATSGTAVLELAMYMVPTISIYKLDPALNSIRFIIKAWTAALPNLIADKIIIPERINEFAHPQYIARLAEQLLVKGNERNAQLDGFTLVHKKMAQKQDPSTSAANAILKLAN